MDLDYRKQLEEKAEKAGLISLYKKAKQIDPVAMEKISENDQKRILRVLEIYHQTGKTKTELEKESRKEPEFDYKVFAIEMDRELLYDRINKRVDIMIEKGLIQEVETIYKKYKEFPTSMQALGYKEVVEYLQGKTDKNRHDRKNKNGIKKICQKAINMV